MRWTCFFFCFLSLQGCGGESQQCTNSSECATGRCVDGTCQPGSDGEASACAAAADCDDGDPCNGSEDCSGGACVAGVRASDGTACDADGVASTRELCVAGHCAPTRCNDNVVDEASGEECDDGNDTSGDGCDACHFSCSAETPCDDGNECNGVETCLLGAHTCMAGTSLAEGADCADGTGTCMAGRCVPKMCMEDAECGDANLCTGVETCDSMTCASGAPLDCDDGIACTEDTCVGSTGCINRLIDMDRDGHPPSSLGACGDDCDDADPAVYAGAGDGCDGMDNDCDMRIDEDEALVWYADCDSDGYARAGSSSITACAEPIPALSGCATGGDFTTRAPSDAANTDCVDTSSAVNPAQTSFQTTPIAGAPAASDFDYNCDGVEEKQNPVLSACRPAGFGNLCIPAVSGWVGSVPECGETGQILTNCSGLTAGCMPIAGTPSIQACR